MYFAVVVVVVVDTNHERYYPTLTQNLLLLLSQSSKINECKVNRVFHLKFITNFGFKEFSKDVKTALKNSIKSIEMLPFLFIYCIKCLIYRIPNRGASVCFNNLDQGTKMIIFESILTTSIASVILRECLGNSKNWLELKIDPP